MSAQKVEIEPPSKLFQVRIAVGSNKQRFNGGRGIEGIGVPPHEIVAWDAAAMRDGVDPLIRRAEELLWQSAQDRREGVGDGFLLPQDPRGGVVRHAGVELTRERPASFLRVVQCLPGGDDIGRIGLDGGDPGRVGGAHVAIIGPRRPRLAICPSGGHWPDGRPARRPMHAHATVLEAAPAG